ncbi:tyrosine-protein phosphatase [Corticicoccus populi]|uniref:Tyrosine-protein phosphatase n=1 Tax=Corticicoccus populi TaxID=1812821 RepID=A0ABW5WYF4_9STAP
MSTYHQPYTISGVEVKRKSNQLLIFLENALDTNYDLYVGSTPDFKNINEKIASNNNGSFKISLPVEQGPYYFVIKNKDFQTNIFSERVVQLNNAINVRDLGGYRTEDGNVTKWGKIFRGDQLSKLDENDIKVLENLNIRSIVDYRSDHEKKINPNKDLSTVKTIYHCDPQSSFSEAAANAVDLKSENAKLVSALENGEVNTKYINGKGENVIEDYRSLVTSEAARVSYGQFLRICADAENIPLIHHCRGGKDRTGLGSMFLLLLLKVREEDIIKDYVMTGVIRKERNALKYEHYRALTSNQDYLSYLMAMIETREEYIKASIDRIKELYSSIDTYMIEHFGLTEEEIENIRGNYLEEDVQSE